MIIDNIRNKREFKRLYKECGGQLKNKKLPQILTLFDLKSAFAFYDEVDNTLCGCIYVETIDNKVFLSGFSRRKNYKDNIRAVEVVCDYLKQDVYSRTPYKEAALVLKKAGFKHLQDDIYIKEVA